MEKVDDTESLNIKLLKCTDELSKLTIVNESLETIININLGLD